MTDPIEMTQLLTDATAGDDRAADALMLHVYGQLRALAAHALKAEAPGHTLQPTSLVHEAYMRMVLHDRVDWQGQTHFFAIAAQAMRRILIDHARRRGAGKRGGGWQRVTIDKAVGLGATTELDLEELDGALSRLAELHERQARVVELKFFGGLTNDEIAEVLGISRTTVAADWTVARAWLSRELAGDGGS